VERLLFIWSDQDDPELSVIDNQRLRHARILWAMAAYFRAIGSDKLPEIATHVAGLGVALKGLTVGTDDPLFATIGSKRDSDRTWGARLQAALGLECFIASGLSRKAASAAAAKDYKKLARLTRGENRNLERSLLSWYDYYAERRVPVPELQEAFQETRRAIRAAKLPSAEYRRVAAKYFAKAVQSATR
jgi:hypothetical protein